jgi:murein L,D-transpeptidase YafK
VLSEVRNWAMAWSNKDVNGYLSHYAKNFDTGGEGWNAWASTRRERITKPKKIDIEVKSPKVSFNSENQATVTFRQIYRSDSLNSSGSKTLTMVKSSDRWLIVQEEFSR